ncbi:MAG: alpha/beta fold hydrolase [Planctomycetota bacterium]
MSRFTVFLTTAVLVAATASGEKQKSASDWAKMGPYGVGVRTVILVDSSRKDGYTEGGRTLVTDIWYPAPGKPKERSHTFTRFFGEHKDAAQRFVERVGSDLKEVERRFACYAVRDARLLDGKFPLLVFSHGNGGVRHQNTFQLDHLASHGYVIATPDHTGNAAVTPLPGRALPYDRKGRRASGKDRPRDVSFLIDRLLEAKGDLAWLKGRLDGERIGALGHSFGGFTACRAAADDRRVKAILPMTVAYGNATDRPLLLMLGKRDKTMGEAGNAAARLYYLSAKGPKHLFEFPNGGHFTFSDMGVIKPDFGDGIGKDFIADSEAKKLIRAYGFAFFEHYLRGSKAAARLLATKPDSAELELKFEPAAK